MSNVNRGLPPERPVIPAEVADFIATLQQTGVSNQDIVRIAQGNTLIPTYHEILSSIPFDTLLAAMVNGYERELTEEQRKHERILSEYTWRRSSVSEYSVGMADGIRYAVGMLGVKIEGVNA